MSTVGNAPRAANAKQAENIPHDFENWGIVSDDCERASVLNPNATTTCKFLFDQKRLGKARRGRETGDRFLCVRIDVLGPRAKIV